MYCMAVWIHGTMDAWQFGFMTLCMHGSLDSWHIGCMAVWIHRQDVTVQTLGLRIHLKLRLWDRIYFPGGCTFHSLLCGLLQFLHIKTSSWTSWSIHGRLGDPSSSVLGRWYSFQYRSLNP